jgi:hypothetical protein
MENITGMIVAIRSDIIKTDDTIGKLTDSTQEMLKPGNTE